MSIKIHIDVTLLPLTGGQSIVEVKGERVNQCLEELRAQFPGLKQMFDNEGNLWSDISLYLNRHSIYSDQPVKDGDELTIEVGVAGG
jgi:molybdopterin converting factor small subunit